MRKCLKLLIRIFKFTNTNRIFAMLKKVEIIEKAKLQKIHECFECNGDATIFTKVILVLC